MCSHAAILVLLVPGACTCKTLILLPRRVLMGSNYHWHKNRPSSSPFIFCFACFSLYSRKPNIVHNKVDSSDWNFLQIIANSVCEQGLNSQQIYNTYVPNSSNRNDIRNGNYQWRVWAGPTEKKVILSMVKITAHPVLGGTPQGRMLIQVPSLPLLLFPFPLGIFSFPSFSLSHFFQGSYKYFQGSYSWDMSSATHSVNKCPDVWTCFKILSATRTCLVKKSE